MAVEHAMFKFEDLKVNSRDDRQQNDNQSTQLSPPTLKRGETKNYGSLQSKFTKTL